MNEKTYKGILTYTPEGARYLDITVRDGRISSLEESKEKSTTVAVPGFVDTHIHGFRGFGTEDCSVESILEMSRNLLEFGITSFFPTLYTDTEDKMIRGLKACYEAKGHEEGATIAGIHIEGPFISPNRIGAQNPLGRKDPSVELFNKFLDAAPGLVKAMTIAPELAGVEAVAKRAQEEGVVLLCGHTNANYEDVKRGSCCYGINHATHLFNAMKGLHHREPGTVGGILSNPAMTCEIIGDGLHVHPAVTKYVIETKTPEKVLVITDSLKPTEQKEGPFYANDVEVEMLNGLWVTKGNPDLIQGSALTLYKGFKNLVSWGIPMEDAVKCTSTTPAKKYHLDDVGTIEVGKKADIVFLDKDLNILEVSKGY